MHKLDVYIENADTAVEQTIQTDFFFLAYAENGAIKIKAQGSPPGINIASLLPHILSAFMKK